MAWLATLASARKAIARVGVADVAAGAGTWDNRIPGQGPHLSEPLTGPSVPGFVPRDYKQTNGND